MAAADTPALLAYLNGPGIDPVLGIYTPTFNPSGSFQVEEEITSAYFNTQWEGDLGSIPFSANVGFRVAWTDVVSTGGNGQRLHPPA